MARKLFGTDGVRGVAGEFLTAELALALGAGRHAPDRGRAPAGADRARHARVGRDAAGGGRRRRERGRGDALLGGVLPTPAAPLLIARYGFDLAAVLSASHNPYRGQRDQVLRAATATSCPTRPSSRSSASSNAMPDRRRRRRCGGARAIGRIRELSGARRGLPARAARALRRPRPRGPGRAAGLRQRRHLPGRARDLQASRARRSTVSRTAPDGRNINAGCGSTHIERWPSGARRWARARRSRLTATATACWRWIGAGRSSTVTS